MTKATYALKLPASIREAAADLARQDGVSLDHWIATAVAEKVGAARTAVDLLRAKAGDARPADLIPYLDAAPDVPPERGDEV